MDRLLIHIGFHKTGTTWLQNHLFHSASDSFISLSSHKNGPSSLAEKFIYDDDGYLLNAFDSNNEKINEALQSILNSSPKINRDSYYAISHERLSGNPHSSGFDASIIARRIHQVFPKAKILIVIREQTSWILSNYFQYLAMGGTHSLSKYLNTKYDGKRPGFSPSHLKYDLIIKYYQNTFGSENVLVIPYELFKSAKKSFIEELEIFLNYKIYIDQSEFENYTNKKGDQFINYWMRFLNRYFRSSSLNNYSGIKSRSVQVLFYGFKKFLGIFIPAFVDRLTKRRLEREIKKWVGKRFMESNKVTDELITFDLNQYGYL